MTKLSWWKRSMMAVGIIGAGFAGLAAQTRPGFSAEPRAAQGQKFLYYGSKSCESCHAVTKERPNAFPQLGPYVKYDEFLTWSKEDKHSLAFARLNGPRGQSMARLLKVEVTRPEAGCLGCHSAGKPELEARQGDQFDRNEGVSCENCHGPISAWFGEHTQASFRQKDADDRAKLGMIDVRVPRIQATQCLSCHIGDSSEGKVVTHDMYAAGHPPLPSIEVATFCESIPRHWFLLREKEAARKAPVPTPNQRKEQEEKKEQEAIRRNAGYKEGDRERTKLALVGAAVALKTSMKLLADESRAGSDSTIPGMDWPDYARFDCWSCHHDLKRESWRQARGYPAAPGRPPIAEWPLAIVELGIDRLEMNDPAAGALRTELDGHQNEVLGEATGRPFGKRAALARAAGDLARWSDVLIDRLSSSTYDESVALQLLRKLVARAREKVTDYDEARHIAWTLRILVEDAGPMLTNRDRIDAILARFDKGLKLELPAGQKYEIEDQLGKALQVIGDYEPSAFRENLKELAGVLPPG